MNSANAPAPARIPLSVVPIVFVRLGDLAVRLWLLVGQPGLIILGSSDRCQLDAARLQLFRDFADQLDRQQPVLEFCR